jgi:hypothetical protein
MVSKKKNAQFTERITIYVTKEVADIYRTGKYNQWDVADLTRKGFSDVLVKNKDVLLKPATDDNDRIG